MKRNFLISGILLGITFSVKYIFEENAQWTETFYSNGFYLYISRFWRFLLGKIPFSVGDLVYTFVAVFVVYFLIKNLKTNLKKGLFLSKITLFVSVLISLFYFSWGFNYYRIPLNVSLQLNTNYTVPQLLKTTAFLIEESNKIHQEITENPENAVIFPYSNAEIFEKINKKYDFFQEFPLFEHHFHSLKPSLYSLPLSFMGYSGYLNPFTGEAQVNYLAKEYQFPITCAHEVAHQLGYASEKEANFIAFLVCFHHQNIYFRYAAHLFALRYCLTEVRKQDIEKYDFFVSKLRKGILLNYENVSLFWKKYENPFEIIFQKSYDTFLKANNQAGGIQNYNYVTGLIIAYLSEEK